MKQRRVAVAARYAEPAATPASASVVVGWLVAGSTESELVVDYDGNARGPLAARTTVCLDAQAIGEAVRKRQRVLLQFEGGRPELPIVTGLMQGQDSPLVELLSRPRGTARGGARATSPSSHGERLDAKLDGKSVVLEAENDIVLKCGAAYIKLTRDGKVIVRGAYVETHSRGVNRIKGGAVRIN